MCDYDTYFVWELWVSDGLVVAGLILLPQEGGAVGVGVRVAVHAVN